MRKEHTERKLLTRAELCVMNKLWNNVGPMTTHAIINEYAEPKPVYSTVATFLKILTNKGFVKRERLNDKNRGLIYSPLISKKEYTRLYMDDVRDTLFDGSVDSLVSYSIELKEHINNKNKHVIMNEKKSKEPDLIIWQTYHLDSHIKDFDLREDGQIRLFRGNDMNVVGESINHLNKFYSEMTTMYWVWKNHHKSSRVGFCHYRRRFPYAMDVEGKECQVLATIEFPYSVRQHYKMSHNYHDYDDIIDIVKDKYGENSKYVQYLENSNVFIPYCSFITRYENFEALCEFFFPILFEYDSRHGLDKNAENYWAKAERDFRYDNRDYQCRTMSFLAERLISCYIVCNLKAVCVSTLGNRLSY